MNNVDSNYRWQELLVVEVASHLNDEEVVFIGIGTGGRAFIMAVGIPLAACRLAQLSHAPNLVPMLGPLIDPDLESLPSSLRDDYELVHWHSKAQIPEQEALDIFKCGKMDVGFVSGAQIDKYGNLNITSIGDYNNPSVRLVGCLAQTDHAAFAKRTLITMDQTKKNFVEKVDFISGQGFLDGPGYREKMGLRGKGPDKVFTNLGVLGFDSETKTMKLEKLHPGATVDDVIDNTGFEIIIPDQIGQTNIPSKEQIDLIRNKIDPDEMLLEAKIV
jgi:glutaconate CoA-transferase subunit B